MLPLRQIWPIRLHPLPCATTDFYLCVSIFPQAGLRRRHLCSRMGAWAKALQLSRSSWICFLRPLLYLDGSLSLSRQSAAGQRRLGEMADGKIEKKMENEMK